MASGINEVIPTFDHILQQLNDFGPYQIRTVLLLCLPAAFLSAWQYFDLVFMLYTPAKSCQEWNLNISLIQESIGNSSLHCDYEGEIIQSDQGIESVHCQNWTVDKEYFESTVGTQWGLCPNPGLYKNILVIFSIVAIVGDGIMSVVQDMIGRKMSFVIALTLSLIGCGFSLLAPTLVTWVIIRSVQATQSSIVYSLPFIWAQEFVGPQKRTLVNFMMCLTYFVAVLSLGFIAWACRTWIQLGMATVFPFLAFYAYVFLVDESPRWLLSVGKVERAVEIMEKMAKMNNKEAEMEQVKICMQQMTIGVEEVQDEEERKYHFLDLFRYPNLRAKLILLTLVWTSTSLIYNSLYFNAPNLGNIFVAYIVQAAAEGPACIFCLLLSNRIGRMPPMIMAMLWSGLCSFLCIPAYVYGWNEWFVITFAALAKFGICVSFNILYQAAGELYPTCLRGTAMGVNTIVASVVLCTMPYMLGTAEFIKWLPMLIMGILSLVGAISCCFLPEPLDQPMPLVAAEAEQISKVGLRNVKIHVRNLMGRRKRKCMSEVVGKTDEEVHTFIQ